MKVDLKLSINFLTWKELEDLEISPFQLATSLGITFIANTRISALVVQEGDYFRVVFYLLFSDSFRSSWYIQHNPFT